MRNKKARRFQAACAAALLLLMGLQAPMKAEAGQRVPYETYNYDYYEDIKYTPAAYVPDRVITGGFSNPQDLNTDGEGNIYIADTNNNRIVVMNSDFELIRTIDTFIAGDSEERFSVPQGVYVSSNGSLYVADTGNLRVVELDSADKAVRIIEDPKSDILEDTYVFRPMKVTVDYANRVYVIAQGQFEGIMEFDEEGEFSGFTGTINVKISPVEILWRKFSTQAQRSRQKLFIPTEFTGLEIDEDGFVYATNVDAEGEQSVRRLNPSGEDVIQKKDTGLSGDLQWKKTGTYSGPSRIVDIVVRDSGIFSILDATRGRIFTYDHEGNLLYIFGGLGSQDGTFATPVAIEVLEDKILVLDSAQNRVNVFTATNYGRLINEAVKLRYDGDELKAAQYWEEVLKLDSNFELAYLGIGKSYLAAGRNREAMDYFKRGNSKQYYSIAYKSYRNEILSKNLSGILSCLAAAVILLLLWRRFGRVGIRKIMERRTQNVQG